MSKLLVVWVIILAVMMPALTPIVDCQFDSKSKSFTIIHPETKAKFMFMGVEGLHKSGHKGPVHDVDALLAKLFQPQ